MPLAELETFGFYLICFNYKVFRCFLRFSINTNFNTLRKCYTAYSFMIQKILLFACFLLILYISFIDLGKAPLDNWDEAWYAEVTKQMLRTKEFFVLSWNHTVFLDKPPMYMWLSVVSSALFGLSEFSVRLPSAISGVLIVSLVTWFAYKKYGILPSLLAFSTLAFNNIFIWRVRSGNLDIFLTLLILVSFFLLISKNKYKYPLLGIVFACIYLTKASVVLFPLVIFIAYELLYERENIKKNSLEYIKLFSIFLGLCCLWLYYGYLKIGTQFPLYYLFHSDQSAAGISNFNPNYIQYAYYSLQRRFFWLLPIGAFFLVKNIREKTSFLLLLFGGLLLLQLSFSAKDNNWYLIPSMPFWSLIIAFATYKILKITHYNKIVILIISILSLYVSYKTFNENILPILNTSSAYAQAQSGRELNKITKKDEIVIRLDHLYPSTVYYSDRKVLSSPRDANTEKYFISRADLFRKIDKKDIVWIVGEKKEVDEFIKQLGETKYQLIPVMDEELILRLL